MRARWAMQFAMAAAVIFAATAVRANDENEPAKQPADEPNTFVTVKDYLRYAETHNAGLKSSYQQWQMAAEEMPQAKALFDPKPTYGYYIKEVETRAEQERQRVGLSQTLPLFKKTETQGRAAKAKAEAARMKYEAAKLRLFWEVKDAFYEYSYLENVTKTVEENLVLLAQSEEAAKAEYIVAAWCRPEVIHIQAEIMWLEEILKDLEQLRGPTVAKLNTVLNRPIDGELACPVREEAFPAELNHGAMVAMLRQRNPELAQLDREIEAARSKVEMAKMRSYPDIGIGVDFIRTERSMASGIKPGEKDPTFLTVSINVPLGQGSIEAAQRQAQMEVRKKEQERIEKENSILAKAVRVIYDYEDSTSKIRLYRNRLLAHSADLVKASKKTYKTERQDFPRLIDTQHALLSYQLAYERALADNRQKLAELEMLVGTKLD